jgi:hypothetical protein
MAEDTGNIGGLLTPRENLIPNIQSAYGAIIQNAPDYQYFTAPLSNQGRDTASYGTTNQLVVAPDTGIRLVNNATGEVVFAGTGYAGAQQAIDAATALSSSAGGKANWDIQITRPGSTNFETVSTERPDDVVGKIAGIAADIGLPLLASAIVPGAGFFGTALPAAGGSALSSVAQGRSLQDTLMRAALTGATAGIGEGIFNKVPAGATDAAISANVNNAISQAYLNAQQGALSALNPIYGAAAGGLAGGAGSLAGNALSSLPSNLASIQATANANLANAGLGNMAGLSVDAFGNLVDDTGAIVVTNAAKSSVLPAVSTLAAATTAAAAGAGGGAPAGATDAAISQNVQNAVDTAYTNAQTGAASDLAAAGYSGMGAGPFVAPGAGAAVGSGVFGTGLNLAQLAAITGIGVDLLGSLIGGGGGGGAAGATTPYVSPFGGTGGGMAAGDFRVNPNITDYERYGFGPEASFFGPGYYGLAGSGANMGYTPPASTTTGTTTGATTGTTGGTTTTTPSARPPGFTGVMADQKIGDKQVVDDKTYVWGGDDKGWQWLATDNNGNQVLMPGNGATNVTSTEEMFKSGLMRQLTPEETLQATALERAVAAAPTAAAATKLNPNSVYFDIDQRTADALGNRNLIGDVMSVQQLQQAMAARELTDPNKYATNLYQQIGQQLSGGLLNIDQARAIQQQIQQQLVSSPNVTTQSLQSIYDTNMQQYKPLI